MTKLLVLFRDGGLLDSTGQLAIGLIPALGEMQRAGFRMVLLQSPHAADSGLFDNTQLQNLLVSQGIGIRHSCDIPESADSTAIAGLLAPWMLQQKVSLDQSFVAGEAKQARALADHLGMRSFSLVPSGTPMNSQYVAESLSTMKSGNWNEFASASSNIPRTATVDRNSNETAIHVEVDLDSPERNISINTGIGFFDHMVEQIAKHGGFSLQLHCKGDLHIDEHHTVEDCALALGQALRDALGDKKGIGRYGFVLPMDEAEVQVSMDLSARPYFVFNGEFSREHVGELTTEMVPHFFKSLSDTLGASVHITMKGDNAHHQVEVIFKGVGRTLRQALRREGDELPSTKGML